MFKANAANTYIPSKSQSIKPDAQVDYGRNADNDLNQIKMLIPQYLGFIDPRETYLKYQFVLSGRGQYVPDHRAGFHSLYRDFRIQDGTASTTLEEVQDYNVLTASWWGYTANKSIQDKRDLMEGRSASSLPTAQLFFGDKGTWNNVGGQVNTSFTRKQVEALHPLYSGILSGDKVFPVIATQGLRLTMNLDQRNRSLECVAGGFGASNASFMESKFDKAATNDQKAAADSAFNIVIVGVAANLSGTAGGGIVNRNAAPFDNNPCDIGDQIYISDNADGGNEESLGIITGFGEDADEDLTIFYIPNRANGVGLALPHPAGSRVFFKQADRESVMTLANVPAANVVNNVPIGYKIKDLELVASVVSPPEQYVSRLMKQIASGQGLSMDIKTFTNYRVNLTTLNGLTNQLIPATQQRAYSIMSVPLANADQNNALVSSFQGDTEGQENYQYVYGGHLIPDRPVALQRYTQTIPKTEALHLIELEKALVNCGYVVRNLQRVPERFLIARGFSKYGQVFNLQPRDLSLRVEYSNNTSEKLYEHFVCALRRININSQGVNVMF